MVARGGGLAAQLVAVVPWDEERTGIRSSFTDYPMYSWHVPEHTRRVRSPVRLRLDDAGGFHLLADASAILHLDGVGAPVARTPVTGLILDYACEASGACMLLEEIGGGDTRLRALHADGSERWSQVGRFRKILAGRDRLYVWGADGIAEADTVTGAIRRVLPHRGGEPFLGGGKVISVSYNDDAGLRDLVLLDPVSGESAELAGTEQHYAWLVYPFGADGSARLFVWRDGQIARVSPDGEIEVLGAVDGIAVRDGSVFTSHRVGDEVVVRGDGLEASLPAAGLRLISIDAAGRFQLLSGEGPGSPGELSVYSAAGQLEFSGPPPQDLAAIESRLPSHTAWQVDPEGRVTIPVLTPEGVALVRLLPPKR